MVWKIYHNLWKKVWVKKTDFFLTYFNINKKADPVFQDPLLCVFGELLLVRLGERGKQFNAFIKDEAYSIARSPFLFEIYDIVRRFCVNLTPQKFGRFVHEDELLWLWNVIIVVAGSLSEVFCAFVHIDEENPPSSEDGSGLIFGWMQGCDSDCIQHNAFTFDGLTS